MRPDWIAVDWGTTNLRVWAMDASNQVLAEAASDQGMGSLTPEGFEPALLALIGKWLGDGQMPVVACGMVGAAQGWIDAGYRPVPLEPGPVPMVRAPGADPRLQVRILSGLSQTSPADVMRGEETQIAGYLAAHPDFSGVICMPGTHCKWVQIEGGQVFHFATYMTGELFSVISKQTVLRHTVKPGDDAAIFTEALNDVLSRPAHFAARLFGLRAQAVLQGLAPEAAGARLSGMLMGLELAAARPYWLGRDVVLMAAGPLGTLYASALEAVGLTPEIADPTHCVLQGLIAARKDWNDT